MNSYYAYSFLAGMCVGGYTNFFSKIVISGLVLYMVNPQNFTVEKFTPLYKTIREKTDPYVSKIYSLQDTTYLQNSHVEIIPSPLPKLVIKK